MAKQWHEEFYILERSADDPQISRDKVIASLPTELYLKGQMLTDYVRKFNRACHQAKFDTRSGKKVHDIHGRLVRTYNADPEMGAKPGTGYGFYDADKDQEGVIDCFVRLVLK